ncbi:hypothetical protein MKX01_035664 [Papaver californicum]|nr:hypothetical protein MKX01_035664 [Papaver californicum]
MGSKLSSYGKIIDIGYRIASRIHSHFPHTSRLYYHPPDHANLQRPKDTQSAAAGGTSTSCSNNGCGNSKAIGVGGADTTECNILHSNV